MAAAYVQKGNALYLAGRSQEALSCYSEVVDWFGSADSPDVLESVGSALIYRASQLLELGDTEAAGETVESLQRRFQGQRDIRLQARALGGRVIAAEMRIHAGGLDEGLTQLRQVVEEIGDSAPPSFLLPLAHALAAQARGLTEVGRYSEALTVCASMLGRFRHAESDEIKVKVAQVIRDRGLCLSAVGMDVAAIAAFTEVLDMFSGVDLPVVRRFSADALWERAGSKLLLGDDEGAVADIERYLADYSGVVRPTSRIRA